LSEAAYRNERGCEYWGDSGSGVLPFAQSTKKFLVSQRGQDVNEGGSYGVFGGGIFLRDHGLKDVSQLINSDIPKKVALEELHEETGYSGKINLIEVYVYKDSKKNSDGQPCDFYYWNYVGIVPEEFPVNPGAHHAWEEGGGSGWKTYQEMLSLQPMHFGLQALIKNGNLMRYVK
jgi:8-oxo-dGTP pyrophosphatase MutT (NUDIX family)